MKTANFKDHLSIADTVKIIKKTRQRIHGMIDEGKLKGIRVGPGYVMVEKKSINEYLESENKKRKNNEKSKS